MPLDILINLVFFLFGLIAGNRLAIGRDRRKEFNEMADNIFIFISLTEEMKIIKETENIASGPAYSDLELFMRRLPWQKKRRFGKAFSTYKKQHQQSNWKRSSSGHPTYIEPEKIISSIHKFIKFTNRK